MNQYGSRKSTELTYEQLIFKGLSDNPLATKEELAEVAGTTVKTITEYIKVSTKNFQGYDILVTAKNNTNIGSEWELRDGTHYNGAYLVGMNKKSAERFYEKILKDQGYKWTWEDNVKP